MPYNITSFSVFMLAKGVDYLTSSFVRHYLLMLVPYCSTTILFKCWLVYIGCLCETEAQNLLWFFGFFIPAYSTIRLLQNTFYLPIVKISFYHYTLMMLLLL